MSNFIATTTTTTIIGRSVPILWMDQVENANLITSFFFFVCLFAAVLLVLVLVKQTIVNCYIPQYLSYLSTSVVNNHNNNNHGSKYLLTNLPVLSSLAAAAASTLTPHTTSVTTTNTTPPTTTLNTPTTTTTTMATPTTPLLLSNAITTFAASVKGDADADEDADDTDDTNNTLSTLPPSSLSSSPLSPTTTTTIASHHQHHHHQQQQQQSTSLFNYSAATAVLSQFTSSTMSSICLIHAITSMVEYLCIFLTNELDLQLVVGGFKIYYGVIHFIYYACEMSVAYWIVFHVFRNRFMLNGMIQQYFSLSTSSSQQHAAANSHSSSVSSSSSSSNNSNTSSNSVSSSVSSSSSSRSNAATVINKRHNSSSLHDAEYDVMMSSSSSPLSSSPTPPTPLSTTPLLLSLSPTTTTTSNDEKIHHHHHQRTQSSSSSWKNNQQQQQQQQQENTFQQQYLQPLELKRLNRIRYLFCSCVIIGSVLSRSFIYIMWSEDDVSLLMHERASYKLGSVRSWVFLLFSGLPSAFSLYYSAQILYRLMQSISDILSSSSGGSSGGGSISSSGSNSASSMINNGSINVSSSGGSISINIGGGHGSESKRRNVSTFAVVRFCNRLRHLWKVVCASFYFVLMQEFCLVSVRQETAASPSSAGGHSRKNVIVDVTDDTARGSIITPLFNSAERTLATSAASILKSTFIYFILSIILQCKNVVEFVAVWTINFRSQSNAIGTVMNYGPILSRGILCCLFISFSMLYFLPFNRTRGRKVKSATATSYLILSHFSQSNKPRQKYLPF